MHHIDEVTAQRDAIPPEKLAAKRKGTIIGIASIALAIVLEKWLLPRMSDWLFYGLLGFGFYSLSGDLVRNFLGYIPAAIRDVRDALGLGGK